MNRKIKITALSAAVTIVLGLSASATAGGASEVLDTLKEKALDTAESFVEATSLKGLNSIFDNAELSMEFHDGNPDIELGVLKAYDDNSPNAFLFNQIGINRFDKRTTLNLGVGYRVLNDDQTWMGGVNAFYDHEFPDHHKRRGAGVELISSAVQLRANTYRGITDFITDRSGTDSKALDGNDTRLKVALPYMPDSFFEYSNFKWKGVEAATDTKGKKYSLSSTVFDNLSVDITRTDYDDASTNDKNRIKLSYMWNFVNESKTPRLLFSVADTAYQFTRLDSEKYDLVERTNRIVKQKKFAAKAGGF